MPAAPDPLFDEDFLRRLEGLALLARQLVNSRQRAERRSVQRGASIEFAEYRPFGPGDDWRHIDWNAYARWRTLVLKLYSEEQDLPVHLLLDATASMDFGTPKKFDHARRVIAGLAYIALCNQDRLGLVSLDGASPATLPPGRGRSRFEEVLRFLSDRTATNTPASLEDAARRWIAARPHRGLAVWVTDLWGSDPGDAIRALDRLRYARHELAVIHIADPSEGDPGEPGEYRLTDRETGALRNVVVDESLRRAYRERYTAYLDEIGRHCRRHQIPLLKAETSEDVIALLTRSLREKGFVQ
jgi:uncharacterized protein (DUF58 family)